MPEGAAHIFELPKDTPVYIGRQEFVIEYSVGKNVLHLGCVDVGLILNKQMKGLWLHERIHQVASSVWGVDMDVDGIQLMRSQGYAHLYQADIEQLESIPEIANQEFDLILLTEVLEHLDNPGNFLQSLKLLFKPNTELLVTVPNATSLGNIITNLNGRELVHPDHNYWYSWHTITTLFNKYGYATHCVGVYSQHDFRRSISGHLWNKIRRPKDRPLTPPDRAKVQSIQQAEKRALAPNVTGWIKAVALTLSYRAMITRNPFFADGLIFIVKPV